MTRLAICGVGNIGKIHLENLLSLRGCAVAGIFDIDTREMEKCSARFQVKRYPHFDELAADPGIDGVVIATPSDSHAELTLAALRAGKHVFVEKPLAGTLEDARRIVEAAHGSRQVVQVGFCERFNVNYLEARRAVSQGKLGSIRAIHSSRVAPYAMSNPAWELGVLDTAVHNLDLILWLMGRMPQTVQARGVRLYADSPVAHTATIFLQFPGGAAAVDSITWLKDNGHPLNQCARSRMLILGESGSFEIDLTDRASALLSGEGYRKIDTVIIGAPEYAGCLKLQFEYFLRSIEEGSPVLAPVEDAVRAEQVVMAALQSMRSGREVPVDVA